MTRIQYLATGGTIASRSEPAGGRRATVLADQLYRSVGELGPNVEVLSSDFETKGSYAFDTGDLLALARAVQGHLTPEIDGLVITHGTDVMEESAFLLDLIHDDPRPIVFTGAQRPFDDPAPDGPANLRDALMIAAAPVSRHHGVLLSFDGFVFPACGVRKVDTLSTHAFDAPGRGPVLRVADGHVSPLNRAYRHQPLVLDLTARSLPRVDVVPAYPGADGTLLRASLEAGARGVVIAALGAGNVGPELLVAVSQAIEGNIPVLICSRVGSGPVMPLYAGGGADLGELGALFGRDLSPWQGRILLAVACAISPLDPHRTVQEWLELVQPQQTTD